MDTINRLGIRIIGITVVILLAAFLGWKGVLYGISSFRSSKVSVSPSPLLTPTIVNTPTLPSPSPILNSELEQELSVFANTLNKTLVGYTKEYVESLPADVPREQVLDQKNLQSFIDSHKGILLPELPPGTVKISNIGGKNAIRAYLDAISSSHNKEIAVVTGDAILTALDKQQRGEELEALVPIRSALEKNFSLFSAVQAPKEVTELHTKLLQATQSLINNTKLLQEMRNDVVAGLIGQRNLTDLNVVFSDIASQIVALETKYDIK